MLQVGGYLVVDQQEGLSVLVDIEQLGGQRVAAIVTLTLPGVEMDAHESNVPLSDHQTAVGDLDTVGDMWRPAPHRLVTDQFVLEPLGPEHNARDYKAWTSSLEHIRATPGFTPDHWAGDTWPYPMTLEQNHADLVDHAQEFASRTAFAFTVLDPGDGDVIGCVYVDPDDTADARCRSWVRADRAELDDDLHRTVRAWLTGPEWGLTSVRFPGRD